MKNNIILTLTPKLEVEALYQCYAYAGLIDGPLTLEIRNDVAQRVINSIAVDCWGFKASDVLVWPDNVDDFNNGKGRVTLTAKERLNLCIVTDADDTNRLPILFYDSQDTEKIALSIGRAVYQAQYQKHKKPYEF